MAADAAGPRHPLGGEDVGEQRVRDGPCVAPGHPEKLTIFFRHPPVGREDTGEFGSKILHLLLLMNLGGWWNILHPFPLSPEGHVARNPHLPGPQSFRVDLSFEGNLFYSFPFSVP